MYNGEPMFTQPIEYNHQQQSLQMVLSPLSVTIIKLECENDLVLEETKEKPHYAPEDMYQISAHKLGGFQIKKVGSTRATKRFETEEEAYQYAQDTDKQIGV